MLNTASMSARSLPSSFPQQAPTATRQSGGRKDNPGQLRSRGFSARRFDGGGPAQLMSHHMSNLVHASDDECLSLVALLAFERAAFDALYVRRFDQSDRGLPAACGAQSQYAHGGRLGSVHVVSFHFGTLCVSLENTSAARTSCDGVSIVLEPAPVDQSSLCNIDHFPNLKLDR
jgi:hypothetical protein